MKNLFTLVMIFTVLSLSFMQRTQAQISVPGLPQSVLYQDLDERVDNHEFQAPDMAKIIAEDENDPMHYRVGVAVPVNLNIDNSGVWTELPDGGKIWRLSIKVDGALALAVYYDNFWLPYGGELYLYNEDKTHIIGAFTEANNNSDCMFATTMVEGDVVILEYFQPAEQSIEPILSISEVSYNYRGVYFQTSPEDNRSVWCMINVNCSPDGDDWQDEKKGVVKQYQKIGFYYYFCSGTLLNNTEQDLKPFILSAWHCGEDATANDYNQWIFYFNYEAAQCSGNWGPSTYSMTGCYKRAEGSFESGSDFLLLELKSSVPTSYNAYYNGWDRTNIGADSGVNIHHPAGDIKKITTFDTHTTSSQWNGNGVLSHWKIYYATTPNGTSITEGGSSGSGLFNQDGQVIGDLSGGPADDCNNPLYSLYGKVYWSWDQMGTANSQRLKPWLDPGNHGVETWDGTYDGDAPTPEFSADQTNLQLGEEVLFTDLTTGNPLDWEWTFEGGTPGSYIGQTPPAIVYNTAGRFDVTLEASNTVGTGSQTNTDYIVVGAPAANFSSTNAYIVSGETADFMDESTGDPIEWTWTFDGGTPDMSTDENPTGIQYDAQGAYDVKLVVVNEYGNDSVTKEGFVVVDGPFADFEADVTNVLIGEPVTFTDLTINNPTSWSWKFFGGSPGSFNGQNPPEITYNSTGDYVVKLTVSNDLGTNFMSKGNYIHVGAIGISEAELEEQLNIYPNPTQGSFSLQLGDNNLKGAKINVINAKGEMIYTQEVNGDGGKINIDLGNVAAGIYMLSMQFDGHNVNKKITVVK